jgi:hypothetical protein
MILQNRRVTTDEVAHQLQISHGTAHEISHNRLAFHKSLHVGSHSNSQNCTKRNEWISADGLWIAVVLKANTSWEESSREMKYRSTITSQRVSARVWNATILIRQKKKNQTPSNCKKTCNYSFWGGGRGGLTGAVTGTLSREGSAVNSARYSVMLCKKLKLAIRSKRRGLLSEGVVLLHDSTCPHTAAHTVETLKKINFKVVEYPPYSPDRLSLVWTI